MPIGHALATRPLTRTEIAQVLQGVLEAPTDTPPGIMSAAFWCTIENLANWCNPDDVEAARIDVARGATLTFLAGCGITAHA